MAVGSGSLNDIVKRAAHEAGRPYLSVATAASMDGYTAFGAAITKDGYKQTMTCPAPRAVLADLEVLAGAPPAMTASGYGDLLGKVTAGADWLVADALRQLSPQHREVLLECYYRGCSVAQAAQRLGVPPGTVKSRTYYALRALRLALEERGVTA